MNWAAIGVTVALSIVIMVVSGWLRSRIRRR